MDSLLTSCFSEKLADLPILNALPGGLFILRASGHHEILYANHSATKILGCRNLEELKDYTDGYFDNLMVDMLSSSFAQIENETRTGAISFVNNKVKTKSGKYRYLQNLIRLIPDKKEGPLYYVFVVDPDTPNQIEQMDPLTRLPGQRRFLEYAEKWFQMKTSSAMTDNLMILYLNVCHFKNYNIKFGIDEGDHLLKDIAELLQKIFPNDFVARFSDDHFVILTYKTDLKAKLLELNQKVSNLRSSVKVEAKVGIYEVESTDMIPSKACDLAKLACDSIQNRPEIYYCLYTPQISRSADLKDYVTYHIDHAIKNGWIQVYYQPVVRSISSTLCGMEALARWIDPVKGFLSPGEFIPPLEESRQLYKLDLYMIEQVWKQYRTCKDQGSPIVLISFNLSRMDFLTCDIFNKVQALAAKYQVPHSMLNIEITESMFVKDGAEIRTVLDKFRDAGYQVWMDDFGSGYSSLNALKDYHFDELKIDMAFLSSFTKKSKDILLGTIRMAKSINIHTLAEGVETKSQFCFLRSIGCEKIQGYYFGKPMPFDKLTAHMEEQGIPFETEELCRYYEAASQQDYLQNEPMAITEYDANEKTHFLFANQAYRDSLKTIGSSSLSISEDRMNRADSMTRKFVYRTIQLAIRTGKSETITYPFHSQFIWLKIKKIASYQGRYLFRSNLVNMSRNANQMERLKLDGLSENIFHLYNSVIVADLTYLTAEPIIFRDTTQKYKPGQKYDLSETLHHFETYYINPEGRDRYHAFVNTATLVDRIEHTASHTLVDYFRTRIPNGTYRWCRHTIISIPRTEHHLYLYTIKETYSDTSLMEKQLVQVYMDNYMK